jgi:branched-chain amino acid transport system permease protein
MLFFVSLLVEGLLAGAVYALFALAFVVVYKASGMINFALGEWAMLGTGLVATGIAGRGVGVVGAAGFAATVSVGAALSFNRVVTRRLVGRPLISAIMVTLGLGMVLRGAVPLLLPAGPAAAAALLATDTVTVHGVALATGKLASAVAAMVSVAMVAAFFRWSRTGLALRAIADDPRSAAAVGVDVDRHFAIAWGLMAVIALLAGVLWTFVAGSGFGVALLGLKVFPIVIVGGLDSIVGTLVGAFGLGVLESLAAGYLDPIVGGGFSGIAAYLVLIATLCVRPHGLLGRPRVERV